jgi:hypothetical protein
MGGLDVTGIRTWWLRRRHPQAYGIADRIRRESERRIRELVIPDPRPYPAADAFRRRMDAVQAEARSLDPVVNLAAAVVARLPKTDPEDFNDLQAYLEGDPRQQDAAALRLDRRALASGQMTLAGFRELHPELIWPDPVVNLAAAAAVPLEAWPEPRFCHHPAATTNAMLGSGLLVQCPDCGAQEQAPFPRTPVLPPTRLPDVIDVAALLDRARTDPPLWCHHPGAVTETHHRTDGARFQRRREASGRLRLRRYASPGGGLPFHVLRCPDCSMWTGQVVEPGLQVRLYLPPCPLLTTDATPSGCNGDAPCP